ncbi:MAG TPA: POTRA domain-containing protein [Pyrinomonadaceae bacterium]|nr:POTRA domain-containing protein [Pyrinomonadaceae bacterium]
MSPVSAIVFGWTPNLLKMISLFRTTFLILFILVFLHSHVLAQLLPTTPSVEAKLAKIEFIGLKRLKPEDLIKASGLEIGQMVTLEALDAAAQRLMDSGLVHKLSYRLQTKADQGTVIFQIEEGRGGESAVIFDNFIWFTEEELVNAVKREAPSFNGTAPTAGQMTDAIIRGLQEFLKERKVAGTVEYLPAEGIDRSKLEHVFRLKGARLPICTLHFPGARHVEEEQLKKAARDLVGNDYSRSFVSLFAFSNLFPIYRELGHLRASFGRPQGSPQSTAECKDGVELSVQVEEGSIYVWDKAEWTGNKVLNVETLEKELGMKSGEIANGIKIDNGIAAILKAYGRKGHLEASVRPQTDFDDGARRVTYRLDVKEGPQYRMGTLNLIGFSDNLGNYLRGKWVLLRNDVYDQGYFEDFMKNEFREILRKVGEERQSQGKAAPKKVNTRIRPNRETLTVDITFELED